MRFNFCSLEINLYFHLASYAYVRREFEVKSSLEHFTKGGKKREGDMVASLPSLYYF
jgi:hypothetical protein